MSQIIIEQLAQIGIEVEFRPIEGSAVLQYIGNWKKACSCMPMGMENGAASQLSVTFVQGLSFALGIGSFEHPDDLNIMIRAANYAEEDKVAGLFQDIQKVIFDDRCYMKTIGIGSNIGIVNPSINDSNYCVIQNMGEALSIWHGLSRNKGYLN